ncbi:MAG: glycerol kinase GlpK [Chitinophagaceae bacterium]|nr:glycerol kinase GlpK [Chitinophagaceae bacterium]
MSKQKYILAIDQGTSSTKSLIFDDKGIAVAKCSEQLHTTYSDNGFVEQYPEEIIQNVLESVKNCLHNFYDKGFTENDISAIGIDNQRETFIIWDKDGKPLHPAIVWQCKRSVKVCEQLKQQGLSQTIQQKTGLVIDPYFSATKLIWLFQNNATVREAIQSGNAFFGTVDTWLLYEFTNGKEYATDYTNASRTLLFNLHTLQWDEELITVFGLNGIRLPQVKPSSSLFGETTLNGIFSKPVAIAALIGDSHAAAFGEGCYETGTAKATLGTGCSILMNIGNKPVQSKNGMITTICWSTKGRIDYALEGVIVSCGATIDWLKNELNLFKDSKETEAMANAIADNGGVYLIPAFSGLGSPHWQMERKASITGLSYGATNKNIVRAALESVPYQIKDVVMAMEKDAKLSLKELMTDGGITSNKFVMQFMADLLNKNVVSAGMPDVSALGAAYMAGLAVGVYDSIDALKKLSSHTKIYQPGEERTIAAKGYEGWQREIQNYSIKK